jgi:hypothetical protein
MAIGTVADRARVCLIAIFMAGAACGPAGAAGLAPGEYACGSNGRILIGLGFKLKADGTYTDLDGTTSGRVVYSGSDVTFVGGHLDGQVGRNIKEDGKYFTINQIGCSTRG